MEKTDRQCNENVETLRWCAKQTYFTGQGDPIPAKFDERARPTIAIIKASSIQTPIIAAKDSMGRYPHMFIFVLPRNKGPSILQETMTETSSSRTSKLGPTPDYDLELVAEDSDENEMLSEEDE